MAALLSAAWSVFIGPSKQLSVLLSNAQYGTLCNLATASVTLNEPRYQAWTDRKLGAVVNTSFGLYASDPDGDGVVNLIEWALIGGPRSYAARSWQSAFHSAFLRSARMSSELEDSCWYPKPNGIFSAGAAATASRKADSA